MSNKSETTSDRRRHQWGEDTCVDGKEDSREVDITELNNFRRLTHNGFTFYVSLFRTRHPSFCRKTFTGFERWRMRFNIFSSGVFAEWHPNTVLHIGEIHVYYDLKPWRQKPMCLDFTFYYDDRRIESEVIPERIELMDQALRDSLTGSDQTMKFLMYLPIRGSEFNSPDKYLELFIECQNEMLSTHESIRKSGEFEQNCDQRSGNRGRNGRQSDRNDGRRHSCTQSSNSGCDDGFDGWKTARSRRYSRNQRSIK